MQTPQRPPDVGPETPTRCRRHRATTLPSPARCQESLPPHSAKGMSYWPVLTSQVFSRYFPARLPSVALTPDEYKVKRGFKLPPMASPPSTNSSGSTSKRASRFSRSAPSSLNSRGRYGYYRPTTKPLHLEPLEGTAADQSFDMQKHKRKTQKMFDQRLR